ncbi:MAG: transporter substrate-binding domain-containing protein [Pseudomonadota bacterium]
MITSKIKTAVYKKVWFVFLLILFLFFLNGTSAISQTEKPLIIPYTSDYPPFFFSDDSKKPKGIIIEFWQLWSRKTGIPVVFKKTDTWHQVINLVKDGKADVIPGIFYTKERDEFLDYSQDYSEVKTSIFVHKSMKAKSLEDVADEDIGVVKSDRTEYQLKIILPSPKLKVYDGFEELIKAAVEGEIKVFAIDYPCGKYFLQKYNAVEQFPAMQTIFVAKFHAAVKEGNNYLLLKIIDGIEKIKEAEIKEIFDRWKPQSFAIPVWILKYLLPGIGLLIIFLFLIIHTILLKKTIRKRTEELKLAQAAKLDAIGQTTAALAHDIRKPFTSIKSILSMFDKYKKDPKSLLKAKTMVNQTIIHVEKIISDILDFSREVKVEVKSEAIVSIIDFAIRFTSQSFKNVTVEFQYNLKNKFKPLCDDERMVRVFGNIIGNAIEAIGKNEDGLIWVCTKDIEKNDKEFVEIKVGNNGPCFAEEDIPNLFKSFFTKGKKRGTGLGLASVEKMVVLHNGTIVARNALDKRGVEFVILLPSSKETEEHKTYYLPKDINEILIAQYVPEEDNYDNKLHFLSDKDKIQVALLEDETLYRAFVRNIIQDNEVLNKLISLYDVNNVDDCIRLVEKEQIEYAIVDIDLNDDKNGYDFLNEAKEKKLDVVSMVHSNRYLEEEIQMAYDLGAKSYASKPLSNEQLVDFLFNCLKGTEARGGREQGVDQLENIKPELCVFIADDNLIMREYIHNLCVEVLGKYNCKYYKFENPYEVLKEFENKQPDIVISDNHYSIGIDLLGVELLKMIREKNKDVLLYLCSDLSKEELQEMRLKSKANGCFNPTVTKNELASIILGNISDYLKNKESSLKTDKHEISKYFHDINKPILNTSIVCNMLTRDNGNAIEVGNNKQLMELKKSYLVFKNTFEQNKQIFEKYTEILSNDLKYHYEKQYEFLGKILEKSNYADFFNKENIYNTNQKVSEFLTKNKEYCELIRKKLD